jgi:hypothetical protein
LLARPEFHWFHDGGGQQSNAGVGWGDEDCSSTEEELRVLLLCQKGVEHAHEHLQQQSWIEHKKKVLPRRAATYAAADVILDKAAEGLR